MAVLIRAVAIAVLLAGCYTPELRDCTVTCAAADDCADGQTCAGGWCTAGETCEDEPITADARPDEVDAALHATAQLHLRVERKGKVVVEPFGDACENSGAGTGDCTFEVPADSEQTLTPVQTDHEFDKWESPPCAGEPAACTLTVVAPMVSITAKFR